MKKLLIILFSFVTLSAFGQNTGVVGLPANADTSSTGFALKKSLLPYITKAQIVTLMAAYAPVVSPTLTTPNIGAATATSVNKVTITAPATSATLTIKDGTTISNLASFTFDGAGTTVLVSGTKAITITGLTTSSIPTISLKAVGGTVTTTWQYKCVCTANTLTITAITNANATNTSDTSTLNYIVVQ